MASQFHRGRDRDTAKYFAIWSIHWHNRRRCVCIRYVYKGYKLHIKMSMQNVLNYDLRNKLPECKRKTCVANINYRERDSWHGIWYHLKTKKKNISLERVSFTLAISRTCINKWKFVGFPSENHKLRCFLFDNSQSKANKC